MGAHKLAQVLDNTKQVSIELFHVFILIYWIRLSCPRGSLQSPGRAQTRPVRHAAIVRLCFEEFAQWVQKYTVFKSCTLDSGLVWYSVERVARLSDLQVSLERHGSLTIGRDQFDNSQLHHLVMLWRRYTYFHCEAVM
jgi:hypothetical protein